MVSKLRMNAELCSTIKRKVFAAKPNYKIDFVKKIITCHLCFEMIYNLFEAFMKNYLA